MRNVLKVKHLLKIYFVLRKVVPFRHINTKKDIFMKKLINAKLSDSDKEAVKVKIQEIQQLLPFLIALPVG